MGQNWRPDGQWHHDIAPPGTKDPLLTALVARGALSPARSTEIAELTRVRGLSTQHIAQVVAGIPQRSIAEALADLHGASIVDPQVTPPDARLIARTSPEEDLRDGVLPWGQMGAATVVLAAAPERFQAAQPRLKGRFGPVRLALTTPDQLEAAQAEAFRARLARAAEERLPEAESCRTFDATTASGIAIAVGLAVLPGLWFAPAMILTALCWLCIAALLAQTALKSAATVAALRWPVIASDRRVVPARLPRITMLVPLYDETEIAPHLLTCLHAINYPQELLDVCFIMEEGDRKTRRAIGDAHLARWMRHVTVPAGTIKTKPRALNYALSFSNSDIVGVWDAEDAPEPDQLLKVAQRFAEADDGLACLQGVLDYYNPSATWLTRCFTLEYAAWFRVVLPGLARLGLIVPLGGTTLFFRRTTLEGLGGWDAHNVTEDADLGLRLARHGYRTEFIATVTEEEANGHLWPWIKQRSRWLKGYAITYGVHMRAPLRLWREVGTWRMFGIQVLFLGTLLQFILAPVIWSFWLVPLGYPHPVADAVPGWLGFAVVALFLATEAVNLAVAVIGARRSGKGWLIPWALTLHAYFPLAALAAWKGVLELGWKPFFWDKTAHGRLLPQERAAATPPPQRPLHPVAAE